jgi:hypothetical protein
MNDLGQLQTLVWTKIKEATRDGDSTSLRLLGKIADEMDRKHNEWHGMLVKGPTSDGATSVPVSSADAPVEGHNGASSQLEDFSGRSIRGFELAAHKVSVGSYKELLLGIIKILQEQDLDRFEAVAPQIRGRGPYFSERADELRIHQKLTRGKLFVETNLNANLIVTICRRLVEAFGENLKLDVVPFRTRQHKGTRSREM